LAWKKDAIDLDDETDKNMRSVITTTCVALLCAAANPSQACEIGLDHRGLPKPGSILLLGAVVGYAEAARPIEGIERAPSLLVRADTVISGAVAPGVVQVVPMSYGPDCITRPTATDELKRLYPMGVVFAIAPAVNAPANQRSTTMIVVEPYYGGFLTTIPRDVKLTPEGDLDFTHFANQHGYGIHGSWYLGEFEFLRAVVAVRQAAPAGRPGRLLNLVHYPAFRMPEGRDWLEQLITETRISSQQRETVLAAFDALRQPAR
jgi:hypothetical protein